MSQMKVDYDIQDRPVYPIGVVAELLGVTPEAIRSWEKTGTIEARRRGGKRFYSELDVQRLKFIQHLSAEGLHPSGIRYFMRMYPCWTMHDCPGCMKRSENAGCAKPCWKEIGTYCQVSGDEDLCANCRLRPQHQQRKKRGRKQAA